MGFIENVINQIGSWIGGFLDGTFGTWIGKGLGGAANIVLGWGTDAYNSLTGMSINLLTQSPKEWNGGAGWSVIESVNNTFIAVGSSLVIIFWLIGLINDSLDIRMKMNTDIMLKEFCKVFLAEFLVTNSIEIISTFFGIVNTMISGIVPGSDSLKITIPESVSTFLNNPGFYAGFACVFLGFLYMLGIVAAGGAILYLAYVRFFKVLLIIPYGAISSASVAGGHSMQHSAVSYYKYALSTILEAVTMLLALKLSAAIISSGAINLVTNASEVSGNTVAQWIFRGLILAFVTVGAIRESSHITQRGLGM